MKTPHIQVLYLFIQDLVQSGVLENHKYCNKYHPCRCLHQVSKARYAETQSSTHRHRCVNSEPNLHAQVTYPFQNVTRKPSSLASERPTSSKTSTTSSIAPSKKTQRYHFSPSFHEGATSSDWSPFRVTDAINDPEEFVGPSYLVVS